MKYKTSKGSVYVVYDDGTTKRDKAARDTPGHEGDHGVKARSEKTVYVAGTQVSALSSAGLMGGGEGGLRARLVLNKSDKRATLVTWNTTQNRWGAAPSGTRIPYTETPQLGLHPLEMWKQADDIQGDGIVAFKSMHAGSEIIEIVTGEEDELGGIKSTLDTLGAALSALGKDSASAAINSQAAATASKELRHNNLLDDVFGITTPSTSGSGSSGSGGGSGGHNRPPGEDLFLPENNPQPTPSPPTSPGGKGPTESFVYAGPWALEVTTQPRLVEIRDAIHALAGKGPGGTGGGSGKLGGAPGRSEPGLFDQFLDIAGQPSAGRNQSGSNLANYAKKMKEIGKKTYKGIRSRIGGGKGKAGAAKGKGGLPAPKGGAGAGTAARGGAAAGEAAAGGEVAAGAAAGEGAAAGVLGAEAVAGPVGWAVGGLTILALGALEAGKATYEFARQQEAEVRRMAEFGGQQAAAIARLDAERVGRDVKTANETGTSSTELTESISKFEDALQPIESLVTNIANSIAGGVLDMFTDMLEMMQPAVDTVKAIYDCLPWRSGKVESKKPETAWDFIKGLEEEQRRMNAPKWPQGPVGNNMGRR